MASINDVNKHCVDRIFDLATTKAIIASEDIYDANGNKLWAKGMEISPQLKERMAKRRLRTPLELTLEIEGSITTGLVVDDCIKMIEGNNFLMRIAGGKAAQATLSRLRMVTLPSAIRLLLDVAYKTLDKSYKNALCTLAVTAGFAAKHELAARETELLLVTALLHDIGEIYINPEYVTPGRVISAEEWGTMAAHPTVGHSVARDIGKLPEAVTIGIAQHHERMDGSGYPAMLKKSDISSLGRIVAVSDAVSAILLRGEESAAYQATLALKIIPEEFDGQCVGFIVDALRPLASNTAVSTRDCVECRVRPTVERIKASESLIQELAGNCPSAPVQGALTMAEDICRNAAKAVRSTGVEQLLEDEAFGDGISCAEACDVEREIRWRLRNLSRSLHLRIARTGSPDDIAFLQPLFALLGDEVEPVAV